MQEVLPGVFHWRTRHPKIHALVSSYWLDEEGVLLDPLVPPQEGIEWFAQRPAAPAAVLLSNRHHYRDAGRFAERFGCAVHCSRSGLHEFTHGASVRGFDPGEQLPGGVTAFEVDAICPDESALHIPARHAVVLADGIVRGGAAGEQGPLGFVPDSLMEDPPQTKRGLLEAYARMCAQLEFDHLLLAHGGPVIGDGRELLEDLIACGGRTAFEM